MSRLDDLPPDQRATLSLLLRRRKRYAEVATMLDIDERAVHDRAHAALAVLAAPQARELSAEQREQLGDYLLGQRTSVAERLATRTYLESSPQARAWAHALTAELAPLAAGTPLPEIPPGTQKQAPAQNATTARPSTRTSDDRPRAPSTRRPGSRSSASSSRLGGALLLAVIVAVIVVAVVLISDSGGGASHSSSNSTASETATGTSASKTSSTGTQTGKAKEDKRITLSSPDPSSNSAGVAEVLSEGNQYAIYLAAQHLPPSKGFFYAVWLYNSPTSFEAVSRAPNVGSNGNVQGGALLPKDAGKYHTMLLTRETATTPAKPGPIVLRGAFALR
jgi:plasmid stability protein